MRGKGASYVNVESRHRAACPNERRMTIEQSAAQQQVLVVRRIVAAPMREVFQHKILISLSQFDFYFMRGSAGWKSITRKVEEKSF